MAKPQPAADPKPPTPQPTDVVRSMLIEIEERGDGQMRCTITGGLDSSTVPAGEFKPRRTFLRDFTRLQQQLRDFVFKGAINSL